MDDLAKYIEQRIMKRNNASITDFEGYSSVEMEDILYNFFSPECVVQIIKAEDDVYDKIPLLNQIKFLYNIIAEKGELPLTKTGRLPVKVVAEIYEQGFLKDYLIERGHSKLYNEESVQTIELTRILVELSSLVKKRNNKLSPTAKGEKLILDNHFLFKHIFEIFSTKFNWGYFDGYENEKIGQLGFGFSLILLNKYGSEFRSTEFYADKYFTAFNFKLGEEQFLANSNNNAYSIRTFPRFLEHLGIVELKENDFIKYGKVKTTQLFSNLIEIRTHGSKSV